MKIAVIGIGYVGLANAILLAQENEVVLLDVDKTKIKKINDRISPFHDEEISKYLAYEDLNLVATDDKDLAYKNADFVVIAVPTDYDPETNYFDTSIISSVMEDVKKFAEDQATVIIKSTVPIGFTDNLRLETGFDRIIFSPEFLREGSALYDNLNPSRIIIGSSSYAAKKFSELLVNGASKINTDVLFMKNSEAEAVKLFSNGYLAMRVAYFNELDTYCEQKGLSAKDVIAGVSKDCRIGDYYNNPSFGYGGYCFPKDTKQLSANFRNVQSSLIHSIVESNEIRKNVIVEELLNFEEPIGIYRLVMKEGSDNFRSAAILDIVSSLIRFGKEVLIYEPIIDSVSPMDPCMNAIKGAEIIYDLEKFKEISGIIVTNRVDDKLYDVFNKVYTRDIFHSDK